MGEWADVAVAVSAKARGGELAVRCTAGSSFLLHPGIEVAFVPPVLDVPRRAVVGAVSSVDGMKAMVRFSGVSADDAQALVGRHILVRRADFSEDELSGIDPLVGYAVQDVSAGSVGVVSAVIDNPAQTLLEVRCDDGRAVLVPFVDGIVVAVDEDARRIDIEAPAGLLDL